MKEFINLLLAIGVVLQASTEFLKEYGLSLQKKEEEKKD